MRTTKTYKFDFDGQTLSNDEVDHLFEVWRSIDGEVEMEIDQLRGPGDYGSFYTHTTIVMTEK